MIRSKSNSFTIKSANRTSNKRVFYAFGCIVCNIMTLIFLLSYDSKLINTFRDSVSHHYNQLTSNHDNDIIINSLPNQTNPTQNAKLKQSTSAPEIEPWPLTTDTCDALFGNGFNKRAIQCSSQESDFQCYLNGISKQIFCKATNLIIDPSQISVSKGGEHILSVANRDEQQEFPKYKYSTSENTAAFNIGCKPKGIIPRKDPIAFYMYDVINFLQNLNEEFILNNYPQMYNKHCLYSDSDDILIFLLTTRYEYANLYHQATDWYNFYQIIHSLGLQANKLHVVFLDGHAWSSVDAAWSTVFGNYTFVKQLSMICIRNAIFIPAGYTGGISLKTASRRICQHSQRYVQMFGSWFLKQFNIVSSSQKDKGIICIVLICRKGYIAHPRNLKGKASRKWKDEKEVMNVIQSAVENDKYESDGISFDVKMVYLEDLEFGNQLEIISKTDILIGVHGAGLSHILFLPEKSAVIECTFQKGNFHFKYFATWTGHYYKSITCQPAGLMHSVEVRKQALVNAVQQSIESILT
eukprot:191034_1